LIFDTSTLFHAFSCSAPAAWIQVLSFGVCFKSVALSRFCHPQCSLRTSPGCIPCAWNPWIWHFYLNNTLLPRRNLWNHVFATFKPESMKLTCQFRRFLVRTFRPVHNSQLKNWAVAEDTRCQPNYHRFQKNHIFPTLEGQENREMAAYCVVRELVPRASWRISPQITILELTSNAHRCPFLSYVLRSALKALERNCWGFTHSCDWCCFYYFVRNCLVAFWMLCTFWCRPLVPSSRPIFPFSCEKRYPPAAQSFSLFGGFNCWPGQHVQPDTVWRCAHSKASQNYVL